MLVLPHLPRLGAFRQAPGNLVLFIVVAAQRQFDAIRGFSHETRMTDRTAVHRFHPPGDAWNFRGTSLRSRPRYLTYIVNPAYDKAVVYKLVAVVRRRTSLRRQSRGHLHLIAAETL